MLLIVDIGLVIFGGLFLLLALYFFAQGLTLRQRAARELYAVARQSSRSKMNTAWLRGLFFLAVSLLLLLVWIIAPHSDSALSPILTPVLSVPPIVATIGSGSPSLTPTTSPTLPLVATASLTTTLTLPPPLPSAARVNAPNGLRLFTLPGGPDVLELMPDKAELVVLEGRERVGGAEWQRVRAPSGNEGWVTVAYLVFEPNPTP